MKSNSYKLNICAPRLPNGNKPANERTVLILYRGCRWAKDVEVILEELFREDGCIDLGGGCDRSPTNPGLPG